VPQPPADSTSLGSPQDGGDQILVGRRSRGRWAALAALLLVTAAVVAALLMRDDSHTYRLVFENAGQLVKGDIVRIGGADAGLVEAIDLSDDDRAEVTISIKNEYAPLHRGTTAIVRAAGLIGVANRYVDVSPGPNFRPEMADGAVLGGDKTTSIVELDQLFNTLDPETRKGLQGVIKGSASWYKGREKLANESARYFAPALAATDRLTREINRDSVTFQQFLVNTSTAMGALSKRRAELTGVVANTGATMKALGSDTKSLNQALVQLPPALRQGSDTFVALRPALGDLQRLTDATGPATRDLAPFLRRLQPVVSRAAPRFRQLRLLFDRPGKADDLYDAFVDLPAIARTSRSSFPRARKALRDSTPIFGFSRPYTPDLVSFIKGFGGAMAPYDANGHYARTMPVFDAYEIADDAEGGSLVPKAPGARGRSPALKTGNLKRCPGAGARTPDGSAAFVDLGQLANADCDPTQKVGP